MMNAENRIENLMDLARDVLREYNMTPKDIELIQNDKEKKLWRFNASNKSLCLKTLRQTKGKVIFTVNAQIYIFNNGGNVPEVYLNTKGNPITEYEDKLFVVYEWIESRPLDFKVTSDLLLGLEGIAKFHKDSKGYIPPENADISSKLGRWGKQYESMRNRMIKWKQEAIGLQSDPSYKCYLDNIDYIIQLCNSALSKLDQSPYALLTSIKLAEASLCHQDYGSGNALQSDIGVFVIDLDGVTYDLCIRDLRKIINKSMETNGSWEKEILDNIMNVYEKYNPLTSQEKELLKVDLLFPHCFFAKIKKIFKKNKIVSAEKIIQVTGLEKSKQGILDQWLIDS